MYPKQILEQAFPVMPVVEINNANYAKPLADALLAGGVKSIEITLRTTEGQKAIAALSEYRDELLIGAGTVISVAQLQQVVNLGVQFVISPGFSPVLAEEAQRLNVCWIPGVSSASEIMQAIDFGLDTFKLFPAQAVGGIPLLNALRGPFSQVSFCPTGGINKQNMADYLRLPNVLCVGGSWIAPSSMIDAQDWNAIKALGEEAIQMAAN